MEKWESFIMKAETMHLDLSQALINILQGNNYFNTDTLELIEKWPDNWISNSLRFLHLSFYMAEPTKAMECMGGIERIQHLREKEDIEYLFIQGVSAILNNEPENSLAVFEKAREKLPNDPYIEFCYLVALKINQIDNYQSAIEFTRVFKSHPLSDYLLNCLPVENND